MTNTDSIATLKIASKRKFSWWSNKRFLGVATYLLLFFFPPNTVSAQPLPLAAEKLFSDNRNMTTFTLFMDDIKTELKVPNVYIDRDLTEGKDRGGSLHLKMLWPSLNATTVHTNTFDKNAYEDEMHLYGSGKFFRITFFQGKWDRMAKRINDNIKNEWVPFSGNTPVPGFTRYVEKAMADFVVKKHQIGNQILVPIDKNYVQKIYFDCPANYSSPDGKYCTGHTYLGNNVYGDYSFALTDLQDWQQIDATVRQLFNIMLSPEQKNRP